MIAPNRAATVRSAAKQRVHRFGRGLGIALAIALATAAATATVHAQSEPTVDALLGPPIASDLAAIRARSPEIVSYTGGRVMALAAERTRPIAWVVQGSRVVAFDVSGYEPRERGRTPVLPDPLLGLAADAGLVLAWSKGFAPGDAWLIDGRDPSWPRDVRPLTLGGPVRAAVMDGRTAVLVVGDEVVVLDAGDMRRPTIVARAPLPEGVRDEGTPLVASQDGWIAVAAGDRAYVGRIADEGAIRWAAYHQRGRIDQIEVAGDRLFILVEQLRIQIVDLKAGGYRLEQSVVFTQGDHIILRLTSFVASERQLVVREAGVIRVMDRVGGPDPWVERAIPHLRTDVNWLQRTAEAADELRLIGLGDGLELFRVPVSPIGALRAVLRRTGSRRPAHGPQYATAPRDDVLITSGDHELRVLDVSRAASPRLRATVETDVVGAISWDIVGRIDWIGDRVWLHDRDEKVVFDVAELDQPRRLGSVPHYLRAPPNSPGGLVAALGPFAVVVDRREMVVLDQSSVTVLHSEVSRTELPGYSLRLAGVSGDTVWFVGSAQSRLTGLIVAVDAGRPEQPRVLSTTPIAPLASAATLVADRWLAMISVPVPTSAVLTIIDTRAEGGPRAVGQLEFESAVDARASLRAMPHAYGSDVLLTLDDRRVVHVDLSVPAFPDEERTYWLPEPGQWPSRVGDTMWFAGKFGGLMGIQLDGALFEPATWLSLPFLSRATLGAP